MKIKTFFMLFLFLSLYSSLNADWLFSKNDKCLNDFYFKRGTFYYHYSKDGNDTSDNLHHTTSNNYIKYIHPDFVYDADNDICSPDPMLLGLTSKDFNFVNSEIAILIVVILIVSLL